MTRREVLKALAALAAAPWMRAARAEQTTLSAGIAHWQVVPAQYPQTEVWCYNGTLPGPELRFRQGATARIVVENRLPQPTTVHWHGLRVPNSMDGVPHLTQPPIMPGERFTYEFALPDAGTYWYHPHERSHEQVARGLYGALIVEERTPVAVDREATWILSDFRLRPDAVQAGDFDNLFDLTHAGRIGNTVVLNGRFTLKDGAFEVRAGERIRLRLVNAAVARIFSLRFSGHLPYVIALDGQPVEPRPATADDLTLGPGMRTDLVLDCLQAPGSRHEVSEVFYPRETGRLIAIAYRQDSPLRTKPPSAPLALPPNPVPEPDLARAARHEIVLQGGAMGALREALYAGERMPLARLVREHRLAWAINGVAVKEHAHEPLLTLGRGEHTVLVLKNDTAWHHPIHLHGHLFRVLARDGKPLAQREWRDTVLLAPRETVEIAFVADNPGDWMLHCHVLAHQHGGMSSVIRVL
jgi:FtsP/CotA-like multicopper oxidase with cupredoxin domain